jgi:hypothetical protein
LFKEFRDVGHFGQQLRESMTPGTFCKECAGRLYECQKEVEKEPPSEKRERHLQLQSTYIRAFAAAERWHTQAWRCTYDTYCKPDDDPYGLHDDVKHAAIAWQNYAEALYFGHWDAPKPPALE